ncbi:MAG: CPBP family intramembrane metalloprotease [Anaerolineae bacterium]|nr:CPBP family intramembrane metalloprotease [Anaerolineae bacterium]
MNIKTRSTQTFFILLAILALAAALNPFLPQGELGTVAPESQIPAWQLALGSAAITTALYGLLGFLGLTLWRRLGFPEIWAENVTNRQRFFIPAIAGGALGLALIISDLIFSRFNGVGRLVHPPFPTSLVASISAGIGEEMMFRLFFVSFWTWLVGKVILRGRGLGAVYWVVSVFSAIAFAASHLPSLMMVFGVSDPSQFSPALLLEILLFNGLISIVAAYFFKKFGFLAPVGIHFWTDIVWHMLWGLAG